MYNYFIASPPAQGLPTSAKHEMIEIGTPLALRHFPIKMEGSL